MFAHKKMLKSNNNIYITETLTKAIIIRSRLKTKCNKKKVKRKL